MSKFSKIFSGKENIGKQHKLDFLGKFLHSDPIGLGEKIGKIWFSSVLNFD
jgi:hypothetical protein